MNKSASIRTVSPRKSEEFIKSAWLQNARNFAKRFATRAPISSNLATKKLNYKYTPTNLTKGTGLAAGGLFLGNAHGHGQGYDEGNETGYRSGVGAGLGQGYNLAAAQVQNTPFLSRLMGRYQFDPDQLGGLQAGILKDPAHRLKTRDNVLSRHW